jgi:citrate synthase
MAETSGSLEGVVAAETMLSHIDGERGELIIRGQPLALVAAQGFEPAIALLWDGLVAIAPVASEIAQRLGTERVQAFGAIEDWLPAARGRPVPEAIRMALAVLPDNASAEKIPATLPVALAAILRARRGLSPVAPDPREGTAGDFLRMMQGAPASHAETAALDTYLAPVIDHGLNASTFTARVVASTRASLAAAAGAAFAALTGPLHGGAPGPVLDMLDAIGTSERIEPWLETAGSFGPLRAISAPRPPRQPDRRSRIVNGYGDRRALRRNREARRFETRRREHRPNIVGEQIALLRQSDQRSLELPVSDFVVKAVDRVGTGRQIELEGDAPALGGLRLAMTGRCMVRPLLR